MSTIVTGVVIASLSLHRVRDCARVVVVSAVVIGDVMVTAVVTNHSISSFSCCYSRSRSVCDWSGNRVGFGCWLSRYMIISMVVTGVVVISTLVTIVVVVTAIVTGVVVVSAVVTGVVVVSVVVIGFLFHSLISCFDLQHCV